MHIVWCHLFGHRRSSGNKFLQQWLNPLVEKDGETSMFAAVLFHNSFTLETGKQDTFVYGLPRRCACCDDVYLLKDTCTVILV